MKKPWIPVQLEAAADDKRIFWRLPDGFRPSEPLPLTAARLLTPRLLEKTSIFAFKGATHVVIWTEPVGA